MKSEKAVRRTVLGTGFRPVGLIDVFGVERLQGGAIKHSVTLYERSERADERRVRLVLEVLPAPTRKMRGGR